MKRNLYSKLSGEHALLMNDDAVNVDAILTAIYVLTNNSLKSGQSSIVIQQ